MFRLLSFVTFATLLILVVCGATPHKAHSPTSRLDRIELPPAVSSSTALESALKFTTTASSTNPVTQSDQSNRSNWGERFSAGQSESTSFRDPLSTSSVLRI